MWAVPSRSTRRAMVCPGSSAAAIACAATSFPTLSTFWAFPLGGPESCLWVRHHLPFKVMWVELLPIQARTGLAVGGGCQHALALHTSGGKQVGQEELGQGQGRAEGS
eukprot:1147823-Pelagomonas_calceolata.AAC.1